MQFVRLDDNPESDCKSTRTKRTLIDRPKNYLYRNIKVGSKVVQISPETMDEYKGKSVDMYTPLYCKNEGSLCAKCAGSMYYKVGIKNIGLLTNRIGTTLLNASLKQMHDTALKLTRIDIKDYITEIV